MARKRRFGSPPEAHRSGAKEAARAMRFWLRELRRDTARGRCGPALNDLVTAERMAAVLATERKGTGKRYSFQIGTLQAAERRFARACVRAK